jgi:archaellum component FlaG (FlaF/FlaG flagellin family)
MRKNANDDVQPDSITEHWLNELAKASNPRRRIKTILGGIWGLSIVIAIFYIIFRLIMGDEVVDGDTTYSTAITELPVIICLVYILIVAVVSVIYYAVMNRIYGNVDPANETTAEGIVYSSRIISSGTSEINGRITGQTDRYEVFVAVKGLNKFLRARIKIKIMEKGKYLQAPNWKKGDKVKVAYDRTKPKACRIIDTRVDMVELW